MSGSKRTGTAVAGLVLCLIVSTREGGSAERPDSGPGPAETVVAECLGSVRELARLVFMLSAAAHRELSP